MRRIAVSSVLSLGLLLAGTPVRAAEPVEAAPAPETAPQGEAAPQPAPAPVPTQEAPPARPLPGDRMVQAGVGITIAGLLGYGLMAVGLSMGSRAESELLPLTDRDDLDARRDVLARGQLGNRLAIAGAITATASLAIGIPLIIVGRRRHEASMRATVMLGGLGSGMGLRLRGRF